MLSVSRLISHGPLARLPTHRRGHYWTRRKASSRLAGSALAGWDSHPLDDERDFGFIAFSTSLSTSLAWSHPPRASLVRMIADQPFCSRYESPVASWGRVVGALVGGVHARHGGVAGVASRGQR